MQKKKGLLDKLYKHGHMCHYCGIQEGDFLGLWGEFYGLPYRGRRLEIDRKDTVVIQRNDIEKIGQEYTLDNCVLGAWVTTRRKTGE